MDKEEIQSPLIDAPQFNEQPKISRGSLAIAYILFLILGSAPQLTQNALFSETAYLRDRTPEEREITAYIVTVFVLANIFCLFYVLAQHSKCCSIPYLFLFPSTLVNTL